MFFLFGIIKANRELEVFHLLSQPGVSDRSALTAEESSLAIISISSSVFSGPKVILIADFASERSRPIERST